MENHPQIGAIADRRRILPLLEQCGLPMADITPGAAQEFFGIYGNNNLNGLIGLERHGPVALLRSLAVSPGQRGHGLGRVLVAKAEQYAASQGVNCLFLLTTTAADFFAELGYAVIGREDAPPAIRATTQFSGLCPATSSFMSKQLATTPLHQETSCPN